MPSLTPFPYLNSNDARSENGVWGWAKRLVDRLNKFRLFELIDTPLNDKGSYIIRVKDDGSGYELASLKKTIATPLDFGAVGDGVADDTTALLSALESPYVIDGLGLTYAISEQLEPSSLLGFQNAKLVWLDAAEMVVQRYMLWIDDIANWFVDRIFFDLGSVEDCGSANDSSRGGLRITTSTAGHYNTQVSVTNCRVTGKGNGTGIDVRNTRRGHFIGNMVYQRRAAATPDPSNDCMDGISFIGCSNLTISNNLVYDQTVKVGGVYVNDFNRGFVFGETQDSLVANNHATEIGQGFDCSNASSNPNRGITFTGNVVESAFSWSFKFVHGIQDCTISNCIAHNFGYAGFVLNSDTAGGPTGQTARLHFSNCLATQGKTFTGGSGTAPRGFRLLSTSANNADNVVDCRFDNCTAYDDQGLMTYGFHSENASEATANNIFRNCEATGFITAENNIPAANWRTL